MDFNIESPKLLDDEKKPYEAPELVVLGDAADMTQITNGPGSDGIIGAAS